MPRRIIYQASLRALIIYNLSITFIHIFRSNLTVSSVISYRLTPTKGLQPFHFRALKMEYNQERPQDFR